MVIHRLLENSALGPEEIETIAMAYEKALSALALKNGDDSATRTVAKKIIKVAQTSERDPEQICRRAIEELEMSRVTKCGFGA